MSTAIFIVAIFALVGIRLWAEKQYQNFLADNPELAANLKKSARFNSWV